MLLSSEGINAKEFTQKLQNGQEWPWKAFEDREERKLATYLVLLHAPSIQSHALHFALARSTPEVIRTVVGERERPWALCSLSACSSKEGKRMKCSNTFLLKAAEP